MSTTTAQVDLLNITDQQVLPLVATEIHNLKK